MNSLGAIDSWDVAHAGVTVLRDGALAGSHGDLERRFAWASVSKLCTALATLVAVEEGTTALDEPAGPPGATVAHLLAHASGLGPADTEHPLAAPGRRRIYSNAGFEVLAAHLARAAGMSFGAYLEAGVLEPLGMGGTRLEGSPAAGIVGPLVDLSALLIELLDPTLITRATLDRATDVAFAGLAGVLPGFGRQVPCDWGLGFELKDDKSPHWTGSRNSTRTFGHFGQSGTFAWVDPAVGVACGVLTDRPFGSWAVHAWPSLSDDVLVELGATSRAEWT